MTGLMCFVEERKFAPVYLWMFVGAQCLFTCEGTWVHMYLHFLVFLEMQKLENIWVPIPHLAKSSFPS